MCTLQPGSCTSCERGQFDSDLGVKYWVFPSALNPVTLAAATTAMCLGGGSSAGGAQAASASAHCSRSAEGQMTSSGQSSG